MKYILLAMGPTDTWFQLNLFSVENTRDGNWNKNENDTNYFIFTPWPFRPKGYCRCLRLSDRLCHPSSMSQLTVQQSYLLCWELLPDRNRKSMGLWYWELMSHPDPAGLPVGTLHSLEWFWVSRRTFVYSHHNTFVFFSQDVRKIYFVRMTTRHKFSWNHQICTKHASWDTLGWYWK